MLHKKIRNQRIQRAYNDGKINIVDKTQAKDEYGTPIPGEPEITVLGSYSFRLKGIHSLDKIEFGNKGIHLEKEVVIPLNRHINSGMTAYLNEDEETLYEIMKVFLNVENSELEILLAKEGGQHYTQT